MTHDHPIHAFLWAHQRIKYDAFREYIQTAHMVAVAYNIRHGEHTRLAM